jgi:Type IV secretory system Conjugative DNA transfer
MKEIIILLVAGLVMAIFFMLILWVLGFFGLGFIVRFFLKGIFYTEETAYKQHILWNKLLFRFTIAMTILLTLIFTVLPMVMGSKFPELKVFGGAVYAAYFLYCLVLNFVSSSRSEKNVKPPMLKNHQGFELMNSDKETIQIANPARGIFICGGAGSGKTASIIRPIIQQAGAANYTGIVYDFKFPNLAKEVAGSYKKSPITQYFINFSDLDYSHRVNPISAEIIKNASYARDAAKALLFNLDFKAASNRDYWVQSSESLITGVIWYLRINYPQYCSLPHVIAMILKYQPKDLMEKISQDPQVQVLVASITSSIDNEKQLSGIFSTVQNYLSQLATPELFWILSANNVNLDLNNPKSKGILTIGNDPSLSGVYAPVISLIISSALKMMNQQGKEKSLVLLDEAPTLFIPNFHQIPATARENKIATIYAVQDIAQMQGMMNKDQSEMIISNLGTQFYGRTTNVTTAERASRLFGKHEVEFQSNSRGMNVNDSGNSYNTGQSASYQQRDRIPAQEVLSFNTGQFCGIIADGNIKEFKIQLQIVQTKADEIPSTGQVSTYSIQSNFEEIGRTVLNL